MSVYVYTRVHRICVCVCIGICICICVTRLFRVGCMKLDEVMLRSGWVG